MEAGTDEEGTCAEQARRAAACFADYCTKSRFKSLSIYVGEGSRAFLCFHIARHIMFAQREQDTRKDKQGMAKPKSHKGCGGEDKVLGKSWREWLGFTLTMCGQSEQFFGHRRQASFLEGRAGVLALGAVAAHYLGDKGDHKDAFLTALLRLASFVSSMPPSECEVLYGRCGYLFAIHFVRFHTNDPDFGRDEARHILYQVLHEGMRTAKQTLPASFLSRSSSSPVTGPHSSKMKKKTGPALLYTWHGKAYFGAAHGISGILHVLLLFTDDILHIAAKGFIAPSPPNRKDPRKQQQQQQRTEKPGDDDGDGDGNGEVDLKPRHSQRVFLDSDPFQAIYSTIDYLIGVRFPSGNLPSSLGSEKDRLMQWCHGAVGLVTLLCNAASVLLQPKGSLHDNDDDDDGDDDGGGDDSDDGDVASLMLRKARAEHYLCIAEECGDEVYRRGLLKKGMGLCHGISGNGYALLRLYKATGKAVHLQRAWAYAQFCIKHANRLSEVPDYPTSLYEGSAGLVCFLYSLINHRNMYAMPGFDTESSM